MRKVKFSLDSSERKVKRLKRQAKLEVIGELFIIWLWACVYLLAVVDYGLLLLKAMGAL